MVKTDVVELRSVERHAAGDGLSSAGERGTIGAYAIDLAKGGKVALTAMHMFSSSAPEPCRSGSQVIGEFRRGTKTRVDAAVIGLRPGVPTVNRLPVFGPMRGPRDIDVVNDEMRPVRLWGAETRKLVRGFIVNPQAHLPDDQLESTILVRIETTKGDSGAALVDTDGWLLGFLVGAIGPASASLRVFSPATLVLDLLTCDIPPSGVIG